MRQLQQDELTHMIASALRSANKSAIGKLQHHDGATKLTARMLVATGIAHHLRKIEMLTDNPEPPPFVYPDVDIRLLG